MMDLTQLALGGVLLIAALTVAGLFASRAWAGWLEVRKLEVASGRPQPDQPVGTSNGSERIEMADLKARVRKLEAIASGIDL